MSLPKYLCIMPYVKLMSCSGLSCIYGWLEEGGQSVMKLIWCSVMKIMQCNGLPGIHVQLTMGIYQCSSLPCICGWLQEVGGVSLSWKLGSVMVFQISMLNWGGISDLIVHFIWQDDLLGHFIWKLDLIPWPFRMGSYCTHRSAMTSSVTDSFKWGVYLSTSSDKLT